MKEPEAHQILALLDIYASKPGGSLEQLCRDAARVIRALQVQNLKLIDENARLARTAQEFECVE